jgi:hypothetical protein
MLQSRRKLTFYTGYSEANRAPTPLELGCANPAKPCLLEHFLVSRRLLALLQFKPDVIVAEGMRFSVHTAVLYLVFGVIEPSRTNKPAPPAFAIPLRTSESWRPSAPVKEHARAR